MKHFWSGIGILLVLLILGSVLTISFTAIHTPLSQALKKAADFAYDGQIEDALSAVADAQSRWQRCRLFSAAVVDHRLLEEMEELFVELRYARDPEKIASLCARLSSRAAEMAESQTITWWNLL